jgi:hypothetical protein
VPADSPQPFYDDLLAEKVVLRALVADLTTRLEQAMGRYPAAVTADYAGLTVGPVVGGRAEVTTEVAATWWGGDGHATGYSSDQYLWRFRTREDNGW